MCDVRHGRVDGKVVNLLHVLRHYNRGGTTRRGGGCYASLLLKTFG